MGGVKCRCHVPCHYHLDCYLLKSPQKPYTAMSIVGVKGHAPHEHGTVYSHRADKVTYNSLGQSLVYMHLYISKNILYVRDGFNDVRSTLI